MKTLLIFGILSASAVISQDLIVVDSPKDTDDGEVAVEEEVVKVSSAEVFVPTEEWQEVLAGQQIPSGLHVRLNIQTGKKEAKLLGEQTTEREEDFSQETLKEALKNIKADFKPSEVSGSESSTFRSMEELKAALGDIETKVETDLEIIKKLFSKFHRSSSEEERAVILEDLEYYTHQYDNALMFVELDGIRDIVLPSLNSSQPAVRQKAAHLVAGAAQSNPQFQIAALESGLLETFLRLTVLDSSSPTLAATAFTALSAVLRNFPQAQIKFLAQGGLGLLVQLFQKEGKAHEKLKIKILTLINDLLVERELTLSSTDESSLQRKEQYSAEDLEAQLEKFGFCQVFNQVLILPKNDRQAKRLYLKKIIFPFEFVIFITFRDDILSTVSEDFPLRAEHDVIEKIIGWF